MDIVVMLYEFSILLLQYFCSLAIRNHWCFDFLTPMPECVTIHIAYAFSRLNYTVQTKYSTLIMYEYKFNTRTDT